MRLVDLDPQWLMKDGRRIGIVFRCPLHPQNKYRLMTCFFGNFPSKEQEAAIEAIYGDDSRHIVQQCNPKQAWTCKPPIEEATFDNITITPSIDGSDGGNWHGHITGGALDRC